MNNLETKIRKEARIDVICHAEHEQIEGNCSAIDPVTDKATEKWIREQLDSGNEWAWCCIEVRATWEGLTHSDYLGCCSYLNRADFCQPDGYYPDMVEQAIAGLLAQAEIIRAA